MASESVKAIYERARRKRHANERRSYQVLFPWLKTLHPEVLSQFEAFFIQLSERNPNVKNLTTSDILRTFAVAEKVSIMFFDSVEYTTFFLNFLYDNFVNFAFENTMKATAVSTRDPIAEALLEAIAETPQTTSNRTEMPQTTSDSTKTLQNTSETPQTTRDQTETTQNARDPIAEALASVEDFDFEVEVFDWENFENDIDLEGMDFTEYL